MSEYAWARSPESITASSWPWTTRPPSWTLSSTMQPVTGGITFTVRDGSASRVAGSARVRATSFIVGAATVSSVRRGDASGHNDAIAENALGAAPLVSWGIDAISAFRVGARKVRSPAAPIKYPPCLHLSVAVLRNGRRDFHFQLFARFLHSSLLCGLHRFDRSSQKRAHA